MEQDMAYLKIQMSNIQESNYTLTNKVFEIEKSCQFNSAQYDQFNREKEHIDADIDLLKTQYSSINSQTQTLFTQNSELNTRCLDLQSRIMENDLIIFGVNKEARTNENVAQREDVQSTLIDTLTIKLIDNDAIRQESPVSQANFNFERVYLVGNPVKAK